MSKHVMPSRRFVGVVVGGSSVGGGCLASAPSPVESVRCVLCKATESPVFKCTAAEACCGGRGSSYRQKIKLEQISNLSHSLS